MRSRSQHLCNGYERGLSIVEWAIARSGFRTNTSAAWYAAIRSDGPRADQCFIPCQISIDETQSRPVPTSGGPIYPPKDLQRVLGTDLHRPPLTQGLGTVEASNGYQCGRRAAARLAV